MRSSPVIEDNFEDVLGKALRGLGLSAGAVAERAELPLGLVQSLLAGQFEATAIHRIAPALNLNAACLIELATHAVRPQVELPAGIRLHNTAFPIPGYAAMTVNSYALVPPGRSGAGGLIDAGATFESIRNSPEFEEVQDGLADWKLFLTHTHADHVTHYDELSRLVASAYAPAREPYADAWPVRAGEIFEVGPWQLTAIETAGHSPGGMSYLLAGPEVPVVFVGDALFCYSIGKVSEGYQAALACIQQKLLSLPGETILCPGHGPLTTVAFERAHNPFFA